MNDRLKQMVMMFNDVATVLAMVKSHTQKQMEPPVKLKMKEHVEAMARKAQIISTWINEVNLGDQNVMACRRPRDTFFTTQVSKNDLHSSNRTYIDRNIRLASKRDFSNGRHRKSPKLKL